MTILANFMYSTYGICIYICLLHPRPLHSVVRGVPRTGIHRTKSSGASWQNKAERWGCKVKWGIMWRIPFVMSSATETERLRVIGGLDDMGRQARIRRIRRRLLISFCINFQSLSRVGIGRNARNWRRMSATSKYDSKIDTVDSFSCVRAGKRRYVKRERDNESTPSWFRRYYT